MSDIRAKLKPWNLLACILVTQFTVYLLVLFDIPIARQLIGFLFLTTIPGYIVTRLLKMNGLEMWENILFSAGFSVAFLMLIGLSMNEFCFLLGFPKPLSVFPLLLVLSSLIFMGGFLVCMRNDGTSPLNVRTFGMSPLALIFLGLPFLSSIGVLLVNTVRNNMILLFMIIAIASLLIPAVVFEMLHPRLYPLAVLAIAISLLFHSSLISNHLVSFGSDIQTEHLVLKTTENSAYWNSTSPFSGYQGYQRLNAMLSITILPVIYSSLLNVDSTWVFKILFPLIFSLVPLALYQVWQTYVGRKYAFISSFLFMAESTFSTEMLGLGRQMVAELFFALLLLVILNRKMKRTNRAICFTVFGIALVVSHYALAEIFLYFIAFVFISSIVMKWPNRNITAGMVLLFFAIMFSWYMWVSNEAVFDSILSYGDYVYSHLGDFFNPASRGQTVLRGLGMETAPSFWNTIGRTFAYLTEVLIILGFIGLITHSVRHQIEKECLMLNVLAVTLLVGVVIVPGLAKTLNMTRFYHILLFFLAPLCLMGGEVLVKLLSKQQEEPKVSGLVLLVLVPYFLFQTGFVYEITGCENWSIPLSIYRTDSYRLYCSLGYTDDWSVFAATWLHKKVDVQHAKVYADLSSRENVLISYGLIYGGDTFSLSNSTSISNRDMVYLNTLNTVHETIVTGSYLCALQELSFLDDMNRIYTNNGGQIYRNPSGN